MSRLALLTKVIRKAIVKNKKGRRSLEALLCAAEASVIPSPLFIPSLAVTAVR